MRTTRHCHLTIDLEDYKHATMLDMGLPPRTDPDQAWRGLTRIFSALRTTAGEPHVTLFTTGQVARDQPDLVGEMARRGHEIGCHGDQHEDLFTLDREGFLRSLRRAKASLEEAAGQAVLGFRAPNFSLDDRSPWAYDTLNETGFLYDSSLVTEGPRTAAEQYDCLPLGDRRLFEFPLYRRRIGPRHGIRVIGGTYFRLLPLPVILRLMDEAIDNGFIPVVYLHAADADDRPSPVRWHEMQGLPTLTRSRWTIHQTQWTLGTKGVAEKLRAVLERFPNLGPMRKALPPSVTA
ncbi:MAG: polysaccharide deacetylase family protein [Nitrospirota bacterium]